MKTISLQTRPYAMQGDIQRFRSLGALFCIMAGTKQTGGAFNLFDVICPIKYETPLHIHYAEDAAIYVLEGVLEIYWGDAKLQAEAGSFFFQPRGAPHGFRVAGATHARILYLTFPAGFDEFVVERSKPLTDFESAVSEARYKIEILGALSDAKR